MLPIIADLYTPLLAICCALLIKPYWTQKRALCFVFALLLVTLFARIEVFFGWWSSMNANFSSHTAVVMVLVLGLLRVRLKAGLMAWLSIFPYAFLMTLLDYHSWFDVFSTMLVCLPCYCLFPRLYPQSNFS